MATKRGQGEGSIFQRHNADCAQKSGAKTCRCPWATMVDFGHVGGKRHRVTRHAPSKRGAQILRDELLLSKSAGVVPSTATVAEWLTYWLGTVDADARLKPSTKTYYAMNAEAYVVPALGKVRLDKLGPEHVRSLHQSMRDEGRSPTSIRNAHATLRRALALALVERRVGVNWAREVTGPAAARNPHPILTAEQAGALFVAASADARALARVHVAVLGGLRQGEALALRWEDVTDRGILVEWSAARVAGERIRQRPKTERSRRLVPVPEACRLSLESWRRESGGRGYVFPGASNSEAIEDAARDHRAWRRLLKAAEVPLVPVHGARGTCATILRGLGFSERLIADYLGQADPRVLSEHYLRSSAEEREAAADALGRHLVRELEPAR